MFCSRQKEAVLQYARRFEAHFWSSRPRTRGGRSPCALLFFSARWRRGFKIFGGPSAIQREPVLSVNLHMKQMPNVGKREHLLHATSYM
jgi:hypothetical protein